MSELETEFSGLDCIVIDNGSHSVKAGFAGEETPEVVFNSVVGRHGSANDTACHNDNVNDIIFVGDEAQDKRDVLSLNYPIQYGIVTDWDDMEKIWDHAFEELRATPKGHTVLLTDCHVLSPKVQRERMAQIMFEKFEAAGLHVCSQSLLPCYTLQQKSGILVVECGESLTMTHPIYWGWSITEAIRTMYFGGRHLTDHLAMLLERHGYSFSTVAEREYVNEMKEKCCCISTNYESEIQTKHSTDYSLPCGQTVSLSKECVLCPEVLFNPHLLGLDGPSLPELIKDSLMSCDVDLRSEFASNIMLSGGCTLFENFEIRLEHELQSILPTKLGENVHVICMPERKYSTWMGGSIMASLCTFQRMWVSKSEYEEIGPSIVFRKCTT